jgi:hypothetical protein
MLKDKACFASLTTGIDNVKDVKDQNDKLR